MDTVLKSFLYVLQQKSSNWNLQTPTKVFKFSLNEFPEVFKFSLTQNCFNFVFSFQGPKVNIRMFRLIEELITFFNPGHGSGACSICVFAVVGPK